MPAYPRAEMEEMVERWLEVNRQSEAERDWRRFGHKGRGAAMNKEILMVVDAVSNEKGVDKEIIFEALEAALHAPLDA